jgi:hypothetical protein
MPRSSCRGHYRPNPPRIFTGVSACYHPRQDTTRAEARPHDDIAARLNGYVNRQHEQGVFATEVLLPLNNKYKV